MASELEKIKLRYPDINSQDAEDLRVINESLNDLFTKGTFVSRDPYVLSIPQDNDLSYRHRNRYQERQFAYYAPFDKDDREELQYQTYKYYEPGKTLFTQHPSSSYSNVEETKERPVKSSTGPKKVISLGAYKKQKLGSSPAAGKEDKEEPARQTTATQIQAETAEILAGLDDGAVIDEQTAHKPDAVARKREADDTPDAPPLKRQRADVPNLHTEEPHEGHQARSLPKKLSPLYEQTSPPSPPEPREKLLPARLSPSLPQTIEDALDERKQQKVTEGQAKRNLSGKVHTNGSKSGDATDRSKGLVKLPVKLKIDHKLQARLANKSDDHSQAKSRAKEHPLPSASHLSPPHHVTADRSSPSVQARTPKPLDSPEARLHTPIVRKGLNGVAASSQTPEPNTPLTNGKRVKTPAQLEWEGEQKRYETRGRELKHSATDCANNGQPELAASRALQSFMCYLLAFTCADQANLVAKQLPVLQPWRSLDTFAQFVRKHCHHYPALTGIAWMLSQVYNSHMLELIEASPRDTPSTPSIIKMLRTLREATTETQKILDQTFLQRQFPSAWKGAVREGIINNDVEIKKLQQGVYPLPVGLLTTPEQAVRAAVALLKEYLQQTGSQERIELDRAAS